MNDQDWSHRQWQIINSSLKDEPGKVESRLSTDTHQHGYREILVCLNGNTDYHYLGKRYRCHGGTAIFFDVNEIHDNMYRSYANDFYHLWFSLSKNEIFAHSASGSKDKTQFHEEHRLMISDNMRGVNLQSLWPQQDQLSSYSNNILQTRLQTLVQQLLCICYDAFFIHQQHMQETDQFEMVKHHIQETAAAGESLETLARMAGYSKFHFLREFKRLNGMTVLQYINNARLSKIKELKKQGHNKKQMSEVLGFSAPSSFSRWLRDHGM